MKRQIYCSVLALLPFVAMTATQHADISLKVISTDPLSYNVRPLPNESHQLKADRSGSVFSKKDYQCKKVIYFNNTPYQITAFKKQQASHCTIDHLGGQSYGIMMMDI